MIGHIQHKRGPVTIVLLSPSLENLAAHPSSSPSLSPAEREEEGKLRPYPGLAGPSCGPSRDQRTLAYLLLVPYRQQHSAQVMVSPASKYRSLSRVPGCECEQASPSQASRGDGQVNKTCSRTLEEPGRRATKASLVRLIQGSEPRG